MNVRNTTQAYFPNITIVKEAIYQLSLLFRQNLLITKVMGLKKALTLENDCLVVNYGKLELKVGGSTK